MDYFFVSITGFSLGVAARSLLTFGWPTAGFMLLLAVVSLFIWFLRRERACLVIAVFLFFVALGASRVLLAPHSLPPAFSPLIGTKVSLDGVIVADPDLRDTNQHVMVKVSEGGETTRVLAFAPLYPSFSYGEKVSVSGTLEKPAPFDTDGGRVFRYDQYLEKDGIFAIVTPAYIQSDAPPSGIFVRSMDFLYGMKHAFSTGLENALPEPSAALAEGLLVGGKEGLGKKLLDAFTVSGLVQIVVLSGYNVMIVAEGVLRAFSYLPKRLALSFAGVSIIAFVVAAGSGSSAVRAGLMACLALYARASGRSYDALRGLILALLLMLLYNPFYLAYDPGFELSFAATVGLIVLTPVFEPRFAFIRSGLLREVIATTLSAQVFVLPLLLWQTGNLSIVAIPANVLVLPIVPLSMALSFIAGLAGIIVPAISPVFGIPAHLLLAYIVAVGNYSAALPFAHVILPAFPFALVVIAYAALFFLVRKVPKVSATARPYRTALPPPSN